MQPHHRAYRQHADLTAEHGLDNLVRPFHGRGLVADIVHHHIAQAMLLDIGLHGSHDLIQRLLARAHFGEGDRRPIAHGKHRRQLDEVTQKRRRAADAPAFLQKRQTLRREQETSALDSIESRLRHAAQILAPIARRHGLEHREGLVEAARLRVDKLPFKADVARGHRADSAQGAIIGARKPRGDEDAAHLITGAGRILEHLFQQLLGGLA